MPSLPGDDLGNGDSLVFSLVRQHRSGDDIADGEDAGYVRLIVAIDEHALLRIERNSRFGKTQARR